VQHGVVAFRLSSVDEGTPPLTRSGKNQTTDEEIVILLAADGTRQAVYHSSLVFPVKKTGSCMSASFGI
jgi:hypothetical protein